MSPAILSSRVELSLDGDARQWLVDRPQATRLFIAYMSSQACCSGVRDLRRACARRRHAFATRCAWSFLGCPRGPQRARGDDRLASRRSHARAPSFRAARCRPVPAPGSRPHWRAVGCGAVPRRSLTGRQHRCETVGKGRFELPTSRSRTAHSNLAELLPGAGPDDTTRLSGPRDAPTARPSESHTEAIARCHRARSSGIWVASPST